MIEIEIIFSSERINKMNKNRIYDIININNLIHYLSKYGFNDGDDILEEDIPVIRQLFENVIKNIESIGILKLNIIETFHNPLVINFINTENNQSFYLDDFDSKIQKGIIDIIEPVFEEEIKIMLGDK